MEIGLRAAGAGLDDIVAMRLYVVDLRAEKGPAITEALANEGLLIEIEATAVLEGASSST